MFNLLVAHLVAEYLLQPVPVLRWKRSSQGGWKWAMAAFAHAIPWIVIVGLASSWSAAPWRYVVAGVVHGALDCSPIGEWLLERAWIPTVRSAVHTSHANQLPPAVAALEFALAAAQEWLARLSLHVLLLWTLT